MLRRDLLKTENIYMSKLLTISRIHDTVEDQAKFLEDTLNDTETI